MRTLFTLLRSRRAMPVLFAVVGVVAIPYAVWCAPPIEYPSGTIVHIESGATVGDAAEELYAMHAISSRLAFKAVTRVVGGSGVQAGSYALPERESVFTLAYRLANGLTGLEPRRVTIPEGTRVADMATILKATLEDFDEQKFITLAKGQEGYLFPDTYFFPPGIPPESVVRTLHAEYEEKIAPLRAAIATSTRTEAEIVAMASLLQLEARKPETMKVIAGILWKRIDDGMALQVDAVFAYIFNRPLYSPSFDDLRVDSPYNTYTNRGLPPTPIGNPGLDAITAALYPTESPYYFYLTGKDGVMYYAKTFEQHVANRSKLR